MIGAAQAESEVSLAELLRAAAIFFDVTVSSLARHVKDDPDLLPSFITAIVTLNEGVSRRTREATLAYTGYLILVDAPSTSLFRHLLPLFPLIVVMVGGGWRDRLPRWLGWRTSFLVVAGLAGQVWWVWALLRFVPPIDFPP